MIDNAARVVISSRERPVRAASLPAPRLSSSSRGGTGAFLRFGLAGAQSPARHHLEPVTVRVRRAGSTF